MSDEAALVREVRAGPGPAVVVVNEQRWRRGAFFTDVVAVGVLLLAGAFVVLDAYLTGRAPGTPGLMERIVLESVLIVAAFVWIAHRLLTMGYRFATTPGP